MANDTDQSAAPGTALQPAAQARPVKVYEPVADVVPILDTARFEHMQRIATIMAASSLIPDSLRFIKDEDGPRGSKVELPAQTVISNCFLIVNQAVRWGMDPFAVAGSTSVVHGRLMYEGKLVAAVLESKLGLQLKYEFGEWDNATETLDLTKEGKGENLGVRVSGQRAGDEEPVFVEGAVSIWKTTGANSPWRPGAFKRQLRYRGAREWSRAYSAGLMLGVITDDELDVLAERRETAQRIRGTGAAPALEAPGRRSLQAGFGDETDQIVRKPAQAAEEPSGSEAPAEGGEAAQAAPTGETGPVSGETERRSRDDQLVAMFDLGREAAGEGEAREAPADLDDEEAEKWLEGWDSKAEELAAEERAMLAEETVQAEPTVAPMGEVYMIVGEGFSEAGRRKTYKDGFSHSSVGEKGAAGLKEYDQHPPVVEGAEKPSEEASPEADAGEPAESSTASDAASSEAPPADDDDTFPGDKPLKGSPEAEAASAAAERGNAFAATNEKINAAASWLEIKQHLRDLSVTEAYRSTEDEGKRMLRMWAYEAYKELREAGKETVEPTADITLFRFWLEFDAESEEQIGSLFRQLHKSPAYADASDGDKRVLGDMISRKKAVLAEAKK